MKNNKILLVFVFILLSAFLFASEKRVHRRTISPIVSTTWLEENLNNPSLVIMDVRSPEAYSEGHIEGAVNSPATSWRVTRDELLLELPETADLFTLIGQAGISENSVIVLVGSTEGEYDRADMTRTAWTLAYGGIKNMAILDGGYTRWVAEEKAVTTVPFVPAYVTYAGNLNLEVTAYKGSVLRGIRKAIIIDARVPEDYFGVSSPLMFAERPGHIKNAHCLPGPWVYTTEGNFKDVDELKAMVKGVTEKNNRKEIIVYCGVGGYACTGWFILSEVLGYRDVKVYDGSIEEWSKDPDAPMTVYMWQ